MKISALAIRAAVVVCPYLFVGKLFYSENMSRLHYLLAIIACQYAPAADCLDVYVSETFKHDVQKKNYIKETMESSKEHNLEL